MRNNPTLQSTSSTSYQQTENEACSDLSADELDQFSSGDEVDESSLSTASTPRPSSVSMDVPRSLSRLLAGASDGRHLSIRDQSALQKALLQAVNISPGQVPSSITTVHRQRHENRVETAAEIKANFIANKPPFVVGQFDLKLIRLGLLYFNTSYYFLY